MSIEITEKQVEFVEDMTDLIMKKFSECELMAYTGYRASFLVKDLENAELGYVYISIKCTGVICIHLAEYRFYTEDALQVQKYSQEQGLILDYMDEEQEFMGMWFTDDYSLDENLKLIKKYILLFSKIIEAGHKIKLCK